MLSNSLASFSGVHEIAACPFGILTRSFVKDSQRVVTFGQIQSSWSKLKEIKKTQRRGILESPIELESAFALMRISTNYECGLEWGLKKRRQSDTSKDHQMKRTYLILEQKTLMVTELFESDSRLIWVTWRHKEAGWWKTDWRQVFERNRRGERLCVCVLGLRSLWKIEQEPNGLWQ